MELTDAIDVLALDEAAPQNRLQASATVREAIAALQSKVEEIGREHEALKRVVYLLVAGTTDDELREEMHTTYTRISSGEDPAAV